VRVVAGSNCRIAPKEQMIRMRNTLPHAKLKLFEGIRKEWSFPCPGVASTKCGFSRMK